MPGHLNCGVAGAGLSCRGAAREYGHGRCGQRGAMAMWLGGHAPQPRQRHLENLADAGLWKAASYSGLREDWRTARRWGGEATMPHWLGGLDPPAANCKRRPGWLARVITFDADLIFCSKLQQFHTDGAVVALRCAQVVLAVLIGTQQ